MNSQKACLRARIINKKEYNQRNIENTLCSSKSMHRIENIMKVVGNTKLNMLPGELENTHEHEYNNSDILLYFISVNSKLAFLFLPHST